VPDVFVIVHDTPLTLSEINWCPAELIANCSKLMDYGTQNFAVTLTSSPLVTEYVE